MVLTHERLGPNHDARNTLDARRCGQRYKRGKAGYGYNPRRGRRYNSDEDGAQASIHRDPGLSAGTSSMQLSRRSIDHQ
jgi:hypothetical protein